MPPSDVRTFAFDALSARERYKLLIGTVVPRPIAWVTTVDRDGRTNAAPYSFFNCLSADPAIVALGVEYRSDGSSKDTARNVADTGCLTVNIVNLALVEAMNVSAVPFPPCVDEVAMAGLTPVPGTRVASPRIGEAPAALECIHRQTLTIAPSREIILGEVVCAYVRADAVDADRLHVDPARLDAMGRMGGHGYATTRDYFDLPTMTVAEWEAGGRPARTRPGS